MIKDKIYSRCRQYGFHNSIKQIIKAIYRKLYHSITNILFIIPDFKGFSYENQYVEKITKEKIINSNKFNADQKKKLLLFLKQGSLGICVKIDGEIAGYGWTQFSGKYQFGQIGELKITNNIAIFNNLFVFQEFRGRGIGIIINSARLAAVPVGKTPLVLIIPENRYAIQNWKQFGFRPLLKITFFRWIKKEWRVYIKEINSFKKSKELTKLIKTNLLKNN